MGMADALTRLAAVARQIADQQALIELRNELIVAARAEGASWPQIGKAAGMRTQSVQNIGQRLAGK